MIELRRLQDIAGAENGWLKANTTSQSAGMEIRRICSLGICTFSTMTKSLLIPDSVFIITPMLRSSRMFRMEQ